MTVRLTGAMSMRQNDFGGASRATRIAARTTAGCVTATSRLRRVVNVSIQSRTRSTSSTTDSPPCGALRRVGQPDGEVGGPHTAEHIAAPSAAVQVGQPVLDARLQAKEFRGLSGALLGPAEGAVGDAELDGGVDLAVSHRVERLVGGKPSGRHRVGHGVRHQCQPDDLSPLTLTFGSCSDGLRLPLRFSEQSLTPSSRTPPR